MFHESIRYYFAVTDSCNCRLHKYASYAVRRNFDTHSLEMRSYDKSFLKKLQQRDDAAFTVLYNDTVDIFFRYLKVTYFLDNAEIDDILSAFYVKLRENLKRLDTNT